MKTVFPYMAIKTRKTDNISYILKTIILYFYKSIQVRYNILHNLLTNLNYVSNIYMLL